MLESVEDTRLFLVGQHHTPPGLPPAHGPRPTGHIYCYLTSYQPFIYVSDNLVNPSSATIVLSLSLSLSINPVS